MGKEFMEAVEVRRSIYGLGRKVNLSEGEISGIVHKAVRHVPSAFNAQSARVAVLFGKEHEKLWAIVEEALHKVVPAENFAQTKAKLDSFAAGYGTVLFFEEQETIRNLQNSFSLYAENFPIWSLQSSGMLQYVVWTAFEAEGLGASLQHYNPLIDAGVREAWGIPESWKLLSQMPFGSVTAPAGQKTFLPLEDRIKVFG